MSVRVCQTCGAEVPEDARFCLRCGKEVAVRTCPACGAEVPEDARFCLKCGNEAVSPPLEPPEQRDLLQRQLPKWVTVSLFLLAIGVIIWVVYSPKGSSSVTQQSVTQPPAEKTISASDNAALWAKANTALASFLGEGFKTFGRDETIPATPQELAPLSQSLNDFNQAVNAINGVTPPPEQSIMHRAVLPIYQDMQVRMTSIRNALLSNDPLAADLEWHKLALLLDEVGGITEILTLD